MPQLRYRITNGQPTCATGVTESWTQAHEGQVVAMEPLSSDKVRSLDQNAKYWAWVRQVAEEKGYDNQHVHNLHKYYFGLAILAEEKSEKYNTLRRLLGQLPREERIQQMDLIICTSEYNQDQMKRFMDTVQRHWAAQGVLLD